MVSRNGGRRPGMGTSSANWESSLLRGSGLLLIFADAALLQPACCGLILATQMLPAWMSFGNTTPAWPTAAPCPVQSPSLFESVMVHPSKKDFAVRAG